MKPRKIPMRMCVGCREMKEKRLLIRIVRTPEGETLIDPTGKKCVVIGRSLVVGKPAAMMLLKKNGTVTICHTRTQDMPSVVKEADIVIVAAGRAGVVGGEYLRAGQVVLDVGINMGPDGKLCGDVNYAEAEPIVDAITPVPGGVGSVTTSVLLAHVVDAAKRQN